MNEKKKEERYVGDLQKLVNNNVSKVEVVTPSLPSIAESMISNSVIFFGVLVSTIFLVVGGIMYLVYLKYQVTSKILIVISLGIAYFISFTTAYFRRDYHPIYRFGLVILAGLCLYFILLSTVLQVG